MSEMLTSKKVPPLRRGTDHRAADSRDAQAHSPNPEILLPASLILDWPFAAKLRQIN
jgi:hypothetical protein